VTETVEFDVPDAGAPNLGDQDDSGSAPDTGADSFPLLAAIPGWTPQEAAKVVGGMVANVTLALYAWRHHAPPPVELWPYIAGEPEREFPLLGAGLGPVLDFLAPKGSAAAVGVSLSAGTGELIGAFARRAPILDTPPKDARSATPAARPAERPAPAPAAAENGRGFRFRADDLRVLQPDDPLMGLGLQ
jgi:hypothetical protein